MSTKNKTNDRATVATDAGADARISAFRNLQTAEGLVEGALQACYVAVAENGATSSKEIAEANGWWAKSVDGEKVPTSSCAVYASNFNRAARVAEKLSPAQAVKLINDAADKAPGRVREAIGFALQAALAETKGAKEVTAAEGRKVIKAALASAVEKATEKKAAKKSARVPRQPAAPAAALASAGTATAWKEAGHNLRTLSVAMTKAPIPEGREAAARDALAALQEACESFAVFLK